MKVDIEHHIGALMNDIKENGVEKMVTLMIVKGGSVTIRVHEMSDIEALGMFEIGKRLVLEGDVYEGTE